jgi:hypothetical protein
MRIASNGNIGIGTNNPSNILQVGGGGRLRIANSSSDYTLIGASDVESATNTRIAMYSNTYGAGYAGNMEYMATATGNHTFYTGGTGTTYGTERLRIASNGNIGIGTNNPSTAKVEIMHPTATSATVLNDPIPILSLKRIGTSNQAYDACATFKICRYENVGYNSRTRLDIVLTHAEGTEASAAMSIASNGNIGIGTNNPSFRLEVSGGLLNAGTFNAYYLNSGGTGAYGGPWTDTLVKFNGAIWCTGNILASSDMRIKEDIQDINDDTALQSILSIQPKTYKYIDKITRSDKKVYGFIAQQIKEVIPEAIIIDKSYIPNIYLVADYNNYIITLPSQPTKVVIKVDDKIKCYDKDNKELLVEVVEVIDDLTFRIKDIEYSDTKIFVYGTFVDDFHTLNKDYIFTLNVCATQELHRRIEAQSLLIKSHEERIRDLETKMERMLSNNT